MPRKSVPRMPDIHMRVIPALWLRGFLKAGMPFEIASTPVTRRRAARERVEQEEEAERARRLDLERGRVGEGMEASR